MMGFAGLNPCYVLTVIARSEATKQSILSLSGRWIASLALAMTASSRHLEGPRRARRPDILAIPAFPIVPKTLYGAAAALPAVKSDYQSISKAWR
jgi:hypothetical protein